MAVTKNKFNLKHKIYCFASVFLIFTIIFYSCAKDKGELVSNCQIPETVSFSKDIIPILESKCSTPGCHTTPGPAANLNLNANVAYSQLINPGKGYIDTINPTASLFHSLMVSSSNPMPPTGKLSSCTTSMVLKWIEQKAKNN